MTNSESASQPQEHPTDESKEHVDIESKDSSPPENPDEPRHDAPEIDASLSTSPPIPEPVGTFTTNSLTEATAAHEDSDEQTVKPEETGPELGDAEVQMGNVAEHHQQGTIEQSSFSVKEAPAQVQDENLERNEPVVSKQAVQDPGLVDMADNPPESNVIDVDNFDDDEEDVSEDDAAQAPIGSEFVSEAEETDDQKNIDTTEVAVPYSEGEAIDLTESPSAKPLESAKQIDSGHLNINDTSAIERTEPLPVRVVDVDEARESPEATETTETQRGSGAQQDTFSLTRSDGLPDKGSPDTDTVSADVNIDISRDDISPQQMLRDDDSSSLPGKDELDTDYLADEPGHVEGETDEPMAGTVSGDMGGHEDERNEPNGESQSKVNPSEVLDVDGRDIVNSNTEGEAIGTELEKSNVDSGASDTQMLENRNIDNGSAVIAYDKKTAPRAEEDEALSNFKDESQAEESQDKSLHSLPGDGQSAGFHKSSETTSRTDHTERTEAVLHSESQPSSDLVASEDHTGTEPVDVSPNLQDEKAQADPVASAIMTSVPKKQPMFAEPQLSGSSFFEKTDRAKPVEPDAESSAAITGVHGSANEIASSTDHQLPSSDLEPQKPAEDQQSGLDNTKMDVDTGVAERKDGEVQKTVAMSKAPPSAKASTDKSVPPHFESKDKESGSEAKASANLDLNPNIFGMKAKAAESGPQSDHLSEQSKSTGTGHQAPLFGIQLSMPVKTGPVSFSSPPAFPRYSLNPQATPFFPPKRTDGEGSPETSKAVVRHVADTPDAANQEQPSGMEAKQEHPSAGEEDKVSEPVAVVEGDENNTTAGLPSMGPSTAEVKSHALPNAIFPAQTSIPTDKTMKGTEPSLKKPTLKKVSFAPTPVKSAASSQKTEKGNGEESISASKKSMQVAKKVKSVSKADGNSAAVGTSSVNIEVASVGKTPTETDVAKEKQRIIQVQTDEGLRREVANVTVAIRQDNSKMKLDRKKLTIQLTTGAEESGKLQFFKGSGSSMKLYASLESKKDYLRVRKVTNRQYCMSVAKVAFPGDDTADIVEKYFVHFEERDIFEEMYSQCVANLQKLPKSIPHSIQPDRSKKAVQTSGAEAAEQSNRQSTSKTGVKRSAESDNAAQVSKKSKLLADKKKLLDKMAALRRKKEQKGVAASKGSQSNPVATTPARGNLPSTDAGKTKSTQLSDVKVQPKSEKAETDANEISSTTTKVIQPSKKRINEKANKNNVSKRARITSSLPAINEANVTTVPKSGANPSTVHSVSANAHVASKDGAQGDSTEAEMISLTQPVFPKEPQGVVHQQSKTPADSKMSISSPADNPKQLETEALAKVTKDFEQAQKERDALQHELAAKDHSLSLERAKSSQVEREHSEAWERIRSFVEALGDDMGRLRRDETDRSMKSLQRCEPSSSEDFFDRLHSFRPSTWAAFEHSEIGALECALKGWHNSGPNAIRSSEGSEIALSPSYDDLDLRQDEVERVRLLLREGHSLLSGWIGQACPESFRTLAGSQRVLGKENLKANAETLRSHGFNEGDFRFDWGANALLLSDDVCERLAVYNWSVDGECLRCTWCNRRAVIHRECRFNASSKHYSFCPFRSESWKDSVLRNAQTLGIEGDGDILMRD